jgi:hypothetical protein
MLMPFDRNPQFVKIIPHVIHEGPSRQMAAFLKKIQRLAYPHAMLSDQRPNIVQSRLLAVSILIELELVRHRVLPVYSVYVVISRH